MTTGPEMLVNTLVKLFHLEPEIEKLKTTIKQAAEEDILGQIKAAVEKVDKFDERLARIEWALGVEPAQPGPGAVHRLTRYEPDRDVEIQLSNGTDNR
jgi:hypothetical protein